MRNRILNWNVDRRLYVGAASLAEQRVRTPVRAARWALPVVAFGVGHTRAAVGAEGGGDAYRITAAAAWQCRLLGRRVHTA